MRDTSDLPVASTNTAQLAAWDGDEGDYWATHADQYDAAVAGYHQPLLELAGIGHTDSVLDIGCGTGRTTRDAARRAAAGSAMGIDLSAHMLDVARSKAQHEGVQNAVFVHGDAQIYLFEPESFDVALSRTGTMFFGDPAAAHANIRRALRPGGRLAVAVWQPRSENEWFTSFVQALSAGRQLPHPPPGAPNPFSLGEPKHAKALLMAAGFEGIAFHEASRAMIFGATAQAAYDFVLGQLGWLVANLDETSRQIALKALMRTMQEHQTADGVQFGFAMWLISARRVS